MGDTTAEGVLGGRGGEGEEERLYLRGKSIEQKAVWISPPGAVNL